MREARYIFALLLAAGLAAMTMAQDKDSREVTSGDVTGPYEVVANWPQPIHSDGWSWGSVPAVFAENPNRVFVLMRGERRAISSNATSKKTKWLDLIQQVLNQKEKPRWEHLIMIFDGKGKLIDSWEAYNSLIVSPHRVQISPYDPERHVWINDSSGHQMFKFTNDGKKLVMRLGEKGVPGNDKTHFNELSDMAFMPNGDFYVTDGYKNTRVIKFSKDGKYLMEWGKPGTGPGEFNTVHGIAIDAKRRIYVSDRENGRIQVFDENGKYLSQWSVPHPYFIYMSRDQHLWVSDGLVHKILKYDLDGKLLYSWGTFGAFPGALWGPHQMSVDSEGNFYVANAQGNNVVKFRPRQDADPAKLVGQPFILSTSGQ